MQMQIAAQVTPTFAQIGPLCQNSTPPSLLQNQSKEFRVPGVLRRSIQPLVELLLIQFTPSVGQCGAPVTMDIIITGPTAIVVNTTNANCILNDGTATLGAVTGGTGPYSYSFGGSSYSPLTSYTGLAQGTYKLSVQDNTGCIYNAPDVTIGSNGGPYCCCCYINRCYLWQQ